MNWTTDYAYANHVLFMTFGFLVSDVYIILLSSFFTLSIPYEGSSKNVLYALNKI